jgi:hypothetical protein
VTSLTGKVLQPSWHLMTCCFPPIPLDGSVPDYHPDLGMRISTVLLVSCVETCIVSLTFGSLFGDSAFVAF